MNHIMDLIRFIRPLQWIKNAFVFTGILFSQRFHDPDLLLHVILAALAFCCMSSCVYVFNDIIDSPSDLHHPKKRNRPLPSGKVSIPVAVVLAVVLGLAGLFLSYLVSYAVLACISAYLLLNIAYSLWLKHVVILDVFCIAAGFMLRILAGTVGVGIPPSKWLLLCGLMITLFLGFAKRRAEIITLAKGKENHRKVLLNYGAILLDQLVSICAVAVILTYSLYTMSPETAYIHHTENLIYTVPFVIYALFRYIFLLHHSNGGGDPTRDLLKDKHIGICVAAWAALTFYFLK